MAGSWTPLAGTEVPLAGPQLPLADPLTPPADPQTPPAIPQTPLAGIQTLSVGPYASLDRQMDGRMVVWNFSTFYQTLSRIRTTATR